MKRTIRNVIVLVFILSLLCLNVCGIENNNIASSGEGSASVSLEEMKTFLISRDYPSDYLDTLIPPQLENLYSLVSEKNAYFYSISQNENSAVEPYDNISAEELDFSVVMSYIPIIYNGATYFGELLMTVDYEWTELPLIRGIDAITVNWDSNLLKYGGDDTFTSYDYMKNPLTNEWETYKEWSQPNATNQGGLGIDTYIDSGAFGDTDWIHATGLKGSVNFSLLPETILSMKIAPESTTTVSAEYTHNTNPLGLGLSFTYQGVGVSVAPGVLQASIAATDVIWYTYVE